MSRKSGVLVVCKRTANVLLLLEAPSRTFGDHWSMVAGSIEEGENPIDTAKRETEEEIGIDSDQLDYYFIDREERNDVIFNFFVGVTEEEFIPRLSEEHTDYKWVNKEELPSPLFPGMKEKIEDL